MASPSLQSWLEAGWRPHPNMELLYSKDVSNYLQPPESCHSRNPEPNMKMKENGDKNTKGGYHAEVRQKKRDRHRIISLVWNLKRHSNITTEIQRQHNVDTDARN